VVISSRKEQSRDEPLMIHLTTTLLHLELHSALVSMSLGSESAAQFVMKLEVE
jgi:hypothetical protein